MSDEKISSYHDVKVIVNGEEHIISNNYAYHLECCRVTGWQLWWKWGNSAKLIGGEYERNKQFEIWVKDTRIL